MKIVFHPFDNAMLCQHITTSSNIYFLALHYQQSTECDMEHIAPSLITFIMFVTHSDGCIIVMPTIMSSNQLQDHQRKQHHLRQLDPQKAMQLRNQGFCEFPVKSSSSICLSRCSYTLISSWCVWILLHMCIRQQHW